MNKRFIVYDTGDSNDQFLKPCKGTLLYNACPMVNHCMGCFSCWIKTPGTCVIDDQCSTLPFQISQSSEIILVSPVVYGGFSPNIKAVLERSISYIMPFFRMIHGEMHHTMRYQNPFQLNVYFYGACDREEQEIARQLVSANARNMGAGSHTVFFHDTVKSVKEAIS